MTEPTRFALSRRAVLTGSLLGIGAAAIPMTAHAGPNGDADANTRRWGGDTTANGWPVLASGTSTVIEGSGGVRVALAGGLPGIVLGHFLRRYLYEVAGTFGRGDVVGLRDSRRVAADYESNHLSGTAVQVFGDRYPLGATDGMFPTQIRVVEAVLDDFDGVIAWGGHFDPVKQSHFEIGVRPESTRLRAVADKFAGVGGSTSASFTVGMARPQT